MTTPLGGRVGPGTPDEVAARFADWVAETGLTLYPAQVEAIDALFAGRHVVLDTPTGSGKTLVATAMQFRAMCAGQRSFYTAPLKALVNEKFFAMCHLFGAADVGMLTGDAAINHDAPLIVCTAEILSNMCVRGTGSPPHCVVMDEFHYYDDRERGVAWQIPLVSLPDTQFLLMSATLGDMRPLIERLEADTGRPATSVTSSFRPVPLDYVYRDTPLDVTVRHLIRHDLVPAYIVNFTQRQCAEQAQALTSIDALSNDERRRLNEVLADADLATPYGKTMRHLLRQGVGIHHAGLLPRYRLLVEQLAQAGLLKVVCGTDTLGAGVNLPIRTVVFTGLSKYDGEKVRILRVRDFKQIAGRAGRKGFDDRGTVVCQAPPHVIENKKKAALLAKKAGSRGRKPDKGRPKPPPRDAVLWSPETFERLIAQPPEPLQSRFRITMGMLLDALNGGLARTSSSGRRDGSQGVAARVVGTSTERRDEGANGVDGDENAAPGYAALVALVGRSHDGLSRRQRHLKRAASLFRSLKVAGIVAVHGSPAGGHVAVDPDLQADFTLHHVLSLFLADAVAGLDGRGRRYPLDVLSLVEAILEPPVVVLRAQAEMAKRTLLERLKTQRVPYEQRQRQLEKVGYPQPMLEYLTAALEEFAKSHPWVQYEDVTPKSIVRDMIEHGDDFGGYVRRYGLERNEGTLLRYIGEVWRALARSVPDVYKTRAIFDIEAALRTLILTTDASLLSEWERVQAEQAAAAIDLTAGAAELGGGADGSDPDDAGRGGRDRDDVGRGGSERGDAGRGGRDRDDAGPAGVNGC
ncbi:MAG: DUF3516 domain-containing protein [Anaerolineae bacterium]